MTASPSIFTDRPDLTAALRHLTWAYAADGRAFTWQEIVTQINVARAEMGLGALHKGAPITLLQKRSLGSPQRDPLLPAHYEKVGRGQYVPVVPGTNCRFTAGHTHGEIRAVARDALRPAAAPGEDARLVARGTHLPDVHWTRLTPGAADLARLDGRRGLYLVRYPNHSDVGQTDEVQVRWRQHQKGGAAGGVFVYTDAQDLSLEALNAAESLAIAAFKDLLRLKNGTVGRDPRPLPRELQLGSALALMFQAAVIRLAADGLLEGTLVWRAPREVPGLREAYLDLRGERVSARTSAPQEDPAPGDVPGGDLPGDLLDSGSPPAPEVIARFGADGGSITLDGQRTDGGWVFRVRTDESMLEDLLPPEEAQGLAFVTDRPAGTTWEGALEALDRYPWPHLLVLDVHRSFEAALYEAAMARGGRPDRWDDWRGRREVLR